MLGNEVSKALLGRQGLLGYEGGVARLRGRGCYVTRVEGGGCLATRRGCYVTREGLLGYEGGVAR